MLYDLFMVNNIEQAANILKTMGKSPRGWSHQTIQGWDRNTIYRACLKAGIDIYAVRSRS